MNHASQSPTIVLTGGGSGGHITPLLAVAAELKQQQPNARLIYVGQIGDKLGDIPKQDPNIDESYFVRAGKFRRFHGEGLKQLLDIRTIAMNSRDFFFVLTGLWQSWKLAKIVNADVVFSRGGFVSVPVSIGFYLRGVPYITHDSDAIPSLANRLISRWASWHAVALPKDVYSYPANKTVTTGIPLQAGFVQMSSKLIDEYRERLELPPKSKLLFVIGGGLGAQRVNAAVAEALPHLLSEFSDLRVVQSAGRANEAELNIFYDKNLSPAERRRVKVFGYLNDVYLYSGAADIVVTRAGATNLAEFAVQGKACVVIPNPVLTGGHQLKNAQYLAAQKAAAVISEDDLVNDPNRLAKQISHLLRDPEETKKLATNLTEFSRPGASAAIAKLILEQCNNKNEPAT